MRAVVHTRYGPPEVLGLAEREKPALTEDGLLVRVRAASINAMDWYFLTGIPYPARMMSGLLRPARDIPGVDFAGTVEAVGASVTRFRPGDEVFGGARGTLAEYVTVAERRVARKPAGVTFEQAAAVPVAGLTALQGLRDKGQVRAGQDVLVNGASGGVGTFAVQIAKALGARVTAVCRTDKVEVARSIGADDVVDFTRDDFTRSGRRYDVLFDVAGSRSWSECRRVLKPEAIWILAGGPRTNPWTGPVAHLVGTLLASAGRRPKVTAFMAKLDARDLGVLGGLLESGKVTPVIDHCYPLGEAAAAFRHFGAGHPQGKIVVSL